MEFENYDIIQLHHLLDKYVYSQVNYENELNRKTIKTNISWKEILPFLHCPSLIEAKKQMREAFYCYAQTFVTIYTENDFFSSYPLVVDVDATDFGIMIEHNTIALKHYLKHFDKKVEIWNRFIENLLTLHLKSPGRVIYSYLCRGYENTISMEILKKDLGSTLSNPQFLYRIIRPIEAEILSLYNKRLIPFYVKVETQKSASGSGGRLLGVTFNFIDEVSLIRQTKLLPEYLEYLEEQLLCIYPMEYPFLMEQIKEMPTAVIEKLHNTIKYIPRLRRTPRRRIPSLFRIRRSGNPVSATF